MKTGRNVAMLVLLSAGFASAQKINVQGEKKLNADFKNYKTFGWVQSDVPGKQLIAYSYEEFVEPSGKERKKKNEDVLIYSYYYTLPSQDSLINQSVVNFVNDEMEGRGYRKDAYPDLLISYKIFDQSTKIRGYNDTPTKLENKKEVHQPQDVVTYKLKPGTVMITLIDAKTDGVVWEGYASGVARQNDIINDRLKVKEAIDLIFKKFQFRGDKLSSNN